MNVPDINVITSELAPYFLHLRHLHNTVCMYIRQSSGRTCSLYYFHPTFQLSHSHSRYCRPFEGIPPGTSPARVLGLPVPDARGRDGCVPARRSRRERQAYLLDS